MQPRSVPGFHRFRLAVDGQPMLHHASSRKDGSNDSVSPSRSVTGSKATLSSRTFIICSWDQGRYRPQGMHSTEFFFISERRVPPASALQPLRTPMSLNFSCPGGGRCFGRHTVAAEEGPHTVCWYVAHLSPQGTHHGRSRDDQLPSSVGGCPAQAPKKERYPPQAQNGHQQCSTAELHPLAGRKPGVVGRGRGIRKNPGCVMTA